MAPATFLVLFREGLGGGAGHFSKRVFRVSELVLPYLYGIFVCMKKTMHIDDDLLREAKAVSNARTDTEAVRLGLESLVRSAAFERLRTLRGSEPHARDVPRRREPSRRADL